jgi:hypothetical protein
MTVTAHHERESGRTERRPLPLLTRHVDLAGSRNPTMQVRSPACTRHAERRGSGFVSP